MKCIICKNPKDEKDFNEEHVFPDSIGGEYKIHNVCKDCNSHLGKTIDSKFIKSGVIRAINHNLKIENKKGKVVPAFPNIVVDPNDNSIRLKPTWDNKGNLKDTEFETTMKGNIVRYDETKSLDTILFELEILYKKDRIQVLRGIEDEEEKYNKFLEIKEDFKQKYEKNEYTSSKEPIEQRFETFGEEIILESLKISYELTHDILGEEYFNDPLCEIFRDYLVKGKLDDDFEIKINFRGFKESVKNTNKFHYFVLFNINNTLVSGVILYNTFISTFIVSEDASKYNLKDMFYEIFNEPNDIYK